MKNLEPAIIALLSLDITATAIDASTQHNQATAPVEGRHSMTIEKIYPAQRATETISTTVLQTSFLKVLMSRHQQVLIAVHLAQSIHTITMA